LRYFVPFSRGEARYPNSPDPHSRIIKEKEKKKKKKKEEGRKEGKTHRWMKMATFHSSDLYFCI